MAKTRSNSRRAHLSSVSLFQSDLEDIMAIMNSVCDEGKVPISDSEFTYDSLQELEDEKGKRPRFLVLSSHFPYLEVKLKRFGNPGVTIFALWGQLIGPVPAADDSDKSLAAFFKIKELLSTRESKINLVLNGWLWAALFAVSLVLLFITRMFAVFLPIVIIGCIGIACSFYCMNGFFTSISLCHRHERKSFVRRNWETIVVAVIAAAIGGAGVKLAAWIMRAWGGQLPIK